MFDTTQSVIDYLEAVLPEMTDYAGTYGEPGYSLDETAATPLVVFGSYWCRCGDPKFSEPYRDGSASLHDIAKHYPQTFARLEEQGVVFEWYDEWTIDYDNDKAYRTEPDSYSWKPSLLVTDSGDYLTPDNDLDEWLEYMVNEPTRCIPGHIYNGADLELAGFVKYNGQFESGWHPGQDADPVAITAEIRKWHGPDVDVVFLLDETSQFYVEFSAYHRAQEEDDPCPRCGGDHDRIDRREPCPTL